MSSNILENDRVAYSDRELPWWVALDLPEAERGVGMRPEDLRNVGKMLEAAGLNWRVELHTPIVHINGKDVPLNVVDTKGKNKGYRAVVRSDTGEVFNMVKGVYALHQNDVVTDIAAAIGEEGQVPFEVLGSLGNGRRVFALAQLGADPRFDGLGLASYLSVSTSHDGTAPTKVTLTETRTVCANTLAIVDRQTAEFVIKHTLYSADRIEEAKKALSAMYGAQSVANDTTARLLDKLVTEAEFEQMVKTLVGDWDDADVSKRQATTSKNRGQYVIDTWGMPENRDIVGTGFAAVNAINDLEIWGSKINATTQRHEMQLVAALDSKQPLTLSMRDLVLT